MLFLGIFLLGLIAWQRIPVELFPQTSGNQLQVSFFRPRSEPDVVEREILLPLEARVAELADVKETSGQVRGSFGTFTVKFEPGVDIDVRELDLTRMASELRRTQPPGTAIDVRPDPFTQLTQSGFAMYLQVTGMDDRNALLDFVEDNVVPRLASVGGVSQVQAFGGSPRELTVRIDPDRCAALGVVPDQVTAALQRTVQRLRFLGGAEDEAGRTAVVLDGRPRGVETLGETTIVDGQAVRLRHVADVDFGSGPEDTQYRVNGRPAIGLILFQEEGANLVRLARDLRRRLDELRGEFRTYGIGFTINFDGGELIEDQLDHLKRLAVSGFAIALVVLFLFLRQWRAVSVVAVAVPASLLSALALLFLADQSLNVITLFGLAIGIGMLVDNSIVVYEAVQRQLERGFAPDDAAEQGVERTVRAILAATTTNGIVFLPILFIDFDDASFRALLGVMALAILLPLAGSVLVAVGLVPLLARRLAAPAAVERLARLRRRREASGGFAPPDRARDLFGGLLAVALRKPGGWVTAVTVAVLITVFFAIPFVGFSALNQEPPEPQQIRFPVQFPNEGTLDSATAAFERLEQEVLELPGMERVESFVQEQGGSITVHMPPRDERPPELSADRVRRVVAQVGGELGVDTSTTQAQGGGDGGFAALIGQGPAVVVVSGPESRQLGVLAEEIKARLESIPEIGSAIVRSRTAQDEIHVSPRGHSLEGYGLTPEQVLPLLRVVGREGEELRTGFTLADGREIPLVVRRSGSGPGREELRRLRLSTPVGVLPLLAVADVHGMPPPATITHKNGRREVEVAYTFGSEAPSTGPARRALENQVRDSIQDVHRPAGYTVETPEQDEAFDWFRRILIPVLLLLYAVLAVTFESLTLPLLVLVSLPLTVLGATWGLLFAGMAAEPMALVGVLALIGLTLNPAILLVDRMQQHTWQGGRSAGAAAVAAVRERARPVLMTATTTVAALWPLALVTGRENEIWPPFATVVMGGLISSTLLTLLFIPVGFVFLHRLDRLFGRLGPWVGLGWIVATAVVIVPLVAGGVLDSIVWQVVTSLLVAACWLGVIVLAFRRVEPPRPRTDDGPPALEARYLHKVYGQPGPVGRAWAAPQRFAARVLAAGGRPFDPRMAWERLPALGLVLGGALYLAGSLETVVWRVVYAMIAAGLAAAIFRELRRARGRVDRLGRVEPGGLEGVAAALAPWAGWGWVAWAVVVQPAAEGRPSGMPYWLLGVGAALILLIQLGRRTARHLARETLPERAERGRLRRARTWWRRLARAVFGLDLPRKQVHALAGVHFEASRGMVGILGPNGAGKTTLLRLLSGILDPSLGAITVGGVPLKRLRRYLARYVGYLPQDFGLPQDLTAREYLDYYAMLYEIAPPERRRERVSRLLEEVGLGARADEKIGGYSGGMRQRVAVARTLLRLPPVIIVDEPTVGLDPRERIRFRNLLARLAEGRVVLFSTHVVEDVEVSCERVIVFARGRIVFDGAPPKLADEAQGRVWVARLEPGAESRLPAGAFVVDEVPEADGRTRTRILSAEPPTAESSPASPTLEDGYLWLVGERSAS
jgi:multidrug efflux pump subunit AcrB/ABC-type multidrug transport system ATPase subunit